MNLPNKHDCDHNNAKTFWYTCNYGTATQLTIHEAKTILRVLIPLINLKIDLRNYNP